MDNNNKQAYRMLVLITNPKLAVKAEALLRSASIPVSYQLNAEGTASSEIMDMLGLGSIDKSLIVSFLTKSAADETLLRLRRKLRLGSTNSGIAFTVPLSGASKAILDMIAMRSDVSSKNERKGEISLEEMNFMLIAAIVHRGFSENVMEAARSAGASGGTVLHSRQIDSEAITSKWGLNGQEEKEIVLILAGEANKAGIMKAISEKCGVHSEAKGLVLSLPIDSVIGLQIY